MLSAGFSIAAISSLLAAVWPSPSTSQPGQPINRPNATSSHGPKVILDNDWSINSFIPMLQPKKAGWDVLGVVSDTANSWALQTGLHALANLEIGGLDCIPVYKGADYPLLNKPGLYQAWAQVHGKYAWECAFGTQNLTKEAQGNDPAGGDPDQIVKAAFEKPGYGYPNTTFASDISAAEFMVQQVRKYPGEVSIFSAGALTNVALAVRLDTSFAKNARELVVMGGYIDLNLLQTTGSISQADWQNDINLEIDPEAAKIALTADWPNITICGNVANQVQITQDFLDELHEVKTPYSELIYRYAKTTLPWFDETAAAIMVEPSIVKNSTQFFLDVDTSYASPNYGNIHAYQKALAPTAQTLREVNYILEIDADMLREQIKQSVQKPPTCSDL